jgi:hypothetical protein
MVVRANSSPRMIALEGLAAFGFGPNHWSPERLCFWHC